MSIGGIGTSGATNPLLTSLLSQIGSSSSSTSQVADPDDSDFTPDTGSAASNALTGSTTAQLSSNMLDVLLGLQQQPAASGSDPSNPAASGGQVHRGGGGHHHHHAASGSSSGTDPLDQIMDADASGDTSTDGLADLLTGGNDTTNPADFMAAIQKYQSQSAGTTQTSV